MRTFIAVELPQNLKDKIDKLQQPLKKTDAYVSWVKPGNVHATLKFLGEIPEERLDDIHQGVKNAVQGMAKFTLNLKGLGTFPDMRRPRVIWIGVDKGKDNLAQMNERIEEELYKLNFPKEERKFSPHLTIGRVKSPKNIQELMELVKKTDFETEDAEIKEVVIMKSKLLPTGAEYTPMRKISLL